MKQYFGKLANSSAGLADWKLIIIAFGLLMANNYLCTMLVASTTDYSIIKVTKTFDPKVYTWWFVSVVGPIGETLILQYILLHLFLPLLPHWMAVLLSGLGFGLTHFYSPVYILMGIISGIILGFVFYVWWIQKGSLIKALCFVSLIHCLANSTAFLVNNYL